MEAAAQHVAPAQPAPAPQYQFDVFISYATVPDAKLVRAIERFLEGFYRVPLLEGAPLRPLQVCVDGTDFALRRMPRGWVSGVVENVVEQAIDTYLAQSRLLLVCCSSGAVASRYVAHEVEWFLAQHREADIMIAVTEGADPMAEKERIFPAPVIRQRLHERPWFDLRGWHWWKRRRWKHVSSFDEVRVRLTADVYGEGVKFANVYPPWWRAELKRRVRLALFALVAGVLVVAASSLAVSKMREAWRARLDAQSRGLAATANALAPADPELAALLARTAVETQPTTEAKTALRVATGASRIRQRIAPGAGAMRDVAWSPDGRKFLTVAAAAGGNDRVELWDASGHRDGAPLVHRGVVTAAMFSPDGASVLTVGRDQGAQLWQRGRAMWRRAGSAFAHGTAAQTGGAFDPSGRRIALADAREGIGLWEIDGARAEPDRWIPDSAAAEHLAFDRNGEWLAWTHNGRVYVWSADRGTRSLFTSDALVNSLDFTPDGHLLVATGHAVQVWRPTADHPDFHLFQSANTVRAARVRQQGDLVAVALDDGSIPIVSLAGGAEVVTLRAHGQRVNQAVFSPDGQSILTASDDKTARLWSVEPKSIQVVDHQRTAAAAAFNIDGSRLATADISAFRTRVWDPRSGLVRDVQADSGGPTAMAFGTLPSQGCVLIVGASDHTAQVWDVCTGTAGALLGQLRAPPTLVAVDPTGMRALVASSAELQVADIASGEPIVSPVHLDGRLLTAGFTSGGEAVVAVTDRSVQLIPTRSGIALGDPFATDIAPLQAAALSADSRVLVVAGTNSVQRFDATNGRLLSSHWNTPPVRLLAVDRTGGRVALAMDETVDLLDGDKVTPLAHNFVTAAAFDPKGQLLVTAGKAGTLKTWSAAGGKLVAKEQFAARGSDDGERVVQLLFSPDGQYLVARSSGPAVRIYGLERFRPLPEVQALLRQRVTRDLNNDERELYLQAVGRWWWP